MKKIDISLWSYEYLKVEDHMANVTWSSRLVFSFKIWNMFWGSACVHLGTVNMQVEL